MSKIAVICFDGVEEVECLTTVDFCRRAGIEVITVSVSGNQLISGSHDIAFAADCLADGFDFSEMDGIVYPGGPGTYAMGKLPVVHELAAEFMEKGKLVAAICAAPGMLSGTGLLKGKTATGYPGCNPEGMAAWTENTVERDGNLITGKGPGAAPYFALEIIEYLVGGEMRKQIYTSTMMP